MPSVWKDNNYSSQIKKIFIIGVSQNNNIRREFEDEFVKQLATKGIEAIPSHSILSPDKMLDKNTIVSKIKDLNIDGVIVTKLINKAGLSSPQKAMTYHTHYVESVHVTSRYRASQDHVMLETNLYDTKTEELVWSGLSESFLFRRTSDPIKPFIEVMIQRLSNDDMI
jgi:hypothetical protein